MMVHIQKSDGLITLRARAEGPGFLGDMILEVRPGESALGKTYAEWSVAESPVEVQ